MKKFYSLLMVCAFALFSAVSFTSCSDENGDVDSKSLIGTWESIRYVYWEKVDGEIVDEENNADADTRLIFGENTVQMQENNNGSWHTYNTYEYKVSGNQIMVRDANDSDDDWETSTIEKVDSKNLIISSSYKEVENGKVYEGYEKTTYRKI